MTGHNPTRAVRPSEALDVERLQPWLASNAGWRGPVRVTQFAGGASNLTYLLEGDDGQALVLRRAPPGRKAKGAHDMGREFELQAALAGVYPVPRGVAVCRDASVVGTEFYVMERVEGTILRGRLPDGMTLGPEDARRLCEAFVAQLVALHGQRPADRPELASFGKPEGYVRRQLEGWIARYDAARTWNVPSWKGVTAWLTAHRPEDVDRVLVHNDFRFDNLVLDAADPTRVVAVLDWELATIGDPWMDLGNVLAYWVQADDDRVAQQMRRQPTHVPGMMTRAELVRAYAAASGRALPDMRFYQVFGLFRLAVILQQIYWRYANGQSKNPAFRWFWAFNGYLWWRARRILAGREAI